MLNQVQHDGRKKIKKNKRHPELDSGSVVLEIKTTSLYTDAESSSA